MKDSSVFCVYPLFFLLYFLCLIILVKAHEKQDTQMSLYSEDDYSYRCINLLEMLPRQHSSRIMTTAVWTPKSCDVTALAWHTKREAMEHSLFDIDCASFGHMRDYHQSYDLFLKTRQPFARYPDLGEKPFCLFSLLQDWNDRSELGPSDSNRLFYKWICVETTRSNA